MTVFAINTSLPPGINEYFERERSEISEVGNLFVKNVAETLNSKSKFFEIATIGVGAFGLKIDIVVSSHDYRNIKLEDTLAITIDCLRRLKVIPQFLEIFEQKIKFEESTNESLTIKISNSRFQPSNIIEKSV